MRTATAPTSIECFHAIQQDGTLSRQQTVIMACIREGRDYSLQELVALTGIQINGISGRVNELKAAGRLTHATERKCSLTGRSIRPVRLPVRQFQLFGVK